MIAFMFYRHNAGTLLFITGTQYMLWPFLGYILAKVWELFYGPLVRRFVEVPLTVEVPITVQAALTADPRIVELFRVQDVVVDTRTSQLVITGKGSPIYRTQKGDERLYQLVRNIPIVKEHIQSVQIIDQGRRAS